MDKVKAESDGNNKTEFYVDSEGACLICQRTISSEEHSASKQGSRVHTDSDDVTTFVPYQAVIRYLDINLEEIFDGFSMDSEQGGESSPWNDCDLLVPLCKHCTDVTCHLSSLYEELRHVRMKLDSVVKDIHDLLEKSSRSLTQKPVAGGLGTRTIVELLRKHTLEKSASHLQNGNAQLVVKRNDHSEDKKESRSLKRKLDEVIPTTSSADNSVDVDATPVVVESFVLKQEWLQDEDDEIEFAEEEEVINGEEETVMEDEHLSGVSSPQSSQSSEEFPSFKRQRPPQSQQQSRQGCSFMVKLPPDSANLTTTGKKKSEYFYCQLCNKTVTNKYRHERIHTQERIFTCQYCDIKGFTDGTNLKHHVDLQHCEYYFIEFKLPTMNHDKFRSLVESAIVDIKQRVDGERRCIYCDKRWQSKSYSNVGLRGHLLKHHFDKMASKLEEYTAMVELELF